MNIPWQRRHFREDGQCLPVAQVIHAYGNSPADKSGVVRPIGDHPWLTREPRVRMDIRTAVQILSLGDLCTGPLPVVEFLLETGPAVPEPLSCEVFDASSVDCVVSAAVETVEVSARVIGRYAGALAAKARMHAQAYWHDKPAKDRRRANRQQIERDERLIKILGWVCIALAVPMLVLAGELVMQILMSNG